MDAYILFCGAILATLFVFLMLVGSFPFNSFLSAFFCTAGSAALAWSLRLNLTMSKDFHQRTPERAFAEFVFCNLLLFLAALNYMG